MDRCALAHQYHQQGYSCAQSVAGAFADLTVSGGLLVLGLLFPHTQGEDRDGKRQIYGLAKQFRQRFFETFGHTRCGDLLRARCGVSEKTTAAARLGLTAHCDIMVVTAVELLEALLREAA